MSSVTASRLTPNLSGEIFDPAAPRPLFSALGWGVALFAHVLAAGLAFSEQREASRPEPVLEVELPPPPLPPAAPLVPPPPPVPEPPSAPPASPAKAAVAAPPEPARAGALLTAKDDPAPSPRADEPVDFTNDPNAVGFGAGVVAVGGKAQVGLSAARPSPAPAATGGVGAVPQQRGDALTPAENLSQKPRLNESDPCRGYFPSGARDDVASAAVVVTIGRSGSVSGVQLLSESPPQQGFGAAARACMAGKRFSPGLDRDGKPTATAIRVNIRFTR